jgi:aspartyl-tRNA synthetase
VTATFGAGVREAIEIVDNIKAVRAKFLSKLYNAIMSSFNLANKSRYRFVALVYSLA